MIQTTSKRKNISWPRLSTSERLRLFDTATERQQKREERAPEVTGTTEREWTREDLYRRAR